MENSEVESLLSEAEESFENEPIDTETGLEVDEPDLLQLKKACRLLKAAEHLKEENGYYTVVIEASFAAIERTLQFYLLKKEFLQPEEYINHKIVYERSNEAGLYNEELRDRFVTLWEENRSQSYYRGDVATSSRAEKMLLLAEAVHRHVLQMAGESHECICNTA
jgi:hypothetical protein